MSDSPQHKADDGEKKERRAAEILQKAVGPLVLVIAAIQLWSIYDDAKESDRNTKRTAAVAADAKAIAQCQAKFNDTFIENLRLRAEASIRITDATNKLILTFAALANPSAADEKVTKTAFKVYVKEIEAAKRERAKHPLLPFPDCLRATGLVPAE